MIYYAIWYAVVSLALKSWIYWSTWDYDEEELGKAMFTVDFLTLFWPILFIVLPVSFTIDKLKERRDLIQLEKQEINEKVKQVFFVVLDKLDLYPYPPRF